MKYPQLVSTRAVNAISDWLVSRLEQLGVEAPQIYTRLLLSLLQSSVQINDPIEFSSLETFIGNRKGGSIRRYLQCDANTLKKLNAIQCLSEIVSSEQELTSIENLVDELWEKLKDIEQQADYSESGDGTILVGYTATAAVTLELNANTTEPTPPHHCTLQTVAHLGKYCNNNNSNNTNNNNNNNNNNEKVSSELETDPTKRYFNAFPALSKEMEDSFRIWRRNAKSLTWPVERSNISASSNSSGSTSFDSAGADAKVPMEANISSLKSDEIIANDDLIGSGKSGTPRLGLGHAIVSAASGFKRRAKRRKNQSMSKGRTFPNMRKYSMNDGIATGDDATGNASATRRTNRNPSPTFWDTDFEGYWEMGPDLIKEFFAKHGEKTRNRCTSESAAYQMDESDDGVAQTNEEAQAIETKQCNKSEPKILNPIGGGIACSPLMAHVDISFCDDSVDDDDTYTSIAEITADSSLNPSHSSPRRLYQRLVRPASDEEKTSNSDMQSDFVQFKAKFNSNVAALWQNVATDDETIVSNTDEALWSAPKNIALPTVAPFRENLKNFWTNYYSHKFDLTQMPQEQQQQQTLTGGDINDCLSLPYGIASTSSLSSSGSNALDFHSMPNNLENLVPTDGSGARRRDGCQTPIGVFLQDSIWSENLNGDKNTDTDESFYLKVWNSNKKLYNLDAIYDSKLSKKPDEPKPSDASFQFSTYGSSKWSEGINAGPSMPHQFQKLVPPQVPDANQCLSSQQHSSTDCVDASMSTTTSCSLSSSYPLSSSGVFSGQIGSMQANLSSWQTNENPKSLSECIDSIDSIQQSHTSDNDEAECVSLPNHSTTSSGFVQYSRIKKSDSLKQLQQQQQRDYQMQISQPREQCQYPEDENLLTSERTHFKPIKAYADGYTFDVCSAMEVIEYKRSESGYLYFESEKYLEYTRNDSFMAEDEAATSAIGASAAPLYAGSNCDAAVAQKRKKDRKGEELVLKFRIRNREMACQTDDEATIRNMQLQHPLYLIFSGAESDSMTLRTSGQACSDAIEALNKAVAAAAKAAAAERDQLQLGTQWLPLSDAISTGTMRNIAGTCVSSASLIWTAVQAPPREEVSIDEIDFCNESDTSCAFGVNILEQQWSMRAIEKRCYLNGGNCLGGELDSIGGGVDANCAKHVNNNTSSEIHLQQSGGDPHTLWGMCAACNSEYKSAPANRLLRDELKQEADEIMSDLKNMQDLYIGRNDISADEYDDSDSSDCCWEGKRSDDDEEAIMQRYTKPTEIYEPQSRVYCEGNEPLAWEFGSQRNQETQQRVLQQVNKLIADLMRPEKANDANVLADAAASAHRELGDSLWADDGEYSIWKQKQPNTPPRTQDRNNSSSNSVLCAEEKKFLAQLTWEHDNLAELWTQETPPPSREPQLKSSASTPPIPPPLCSTPSSSCVDSQDKSMPTPQNIAKDNQQKLPEDICCSSAEHQQPISRKDENDSHILSSQYNDASMTVSTMAYKRVQQFLNSTGAANSVTSAKLKLSNRKRRHSASQNYTIFHSGLGGNGNALYASSYKSHNNNNNNNVHISDLNFNFKRNAPGAENANISTVAATGAATVFADDVDMEHGNGFACNNDPINYSIVNNGIGGGGGGLSSGVDAVLLPPKQTIITCKYWAAFDPLADNDDADIDCVPEGTTFSCLVDKSNTILKHVTMLARPLTR